jgi:hypothetical protein
MNRIIEKHFVSLFFLFLFLNVNSSIFSQEVSGREPVKHFSSLLTATSNGISMIPSFSLGKPALIAELSMGGRKFSFDPQFRMSMEGKPWSMVLWFRYLAVDNEKFKLRVGAHPAMMFSTNSYTSEGAPLEVIRAKRFGAAELAPSFQLSKHISLNPYYLYGHGFDPGLRNTHYVTLITNFTNLGITRHLHAGISPQLFFLKTDDLKGYYVSSSFSLAHDKFPVSLGAMFNKKIQSEIVSRDFLWSVSLTYTFNKKYKSI